MSSVEYKTFIAQCLRCNSKTDWTVPEDFDESPGSHHYLPCEDCDAVMLFRILGIKKYF